MEQRVQLDAEKNQIFMHITEARKNHANGIFHKEIEHSHFSQMEKCSSSLNFKVSRYFRIKL